MRIEVLRSPAQDANLSESNRNRGGEKRRFVDIEMTGGGERRCASVFRWESRFFTQGFTSQRARSSQVPPPRLM